MFSKQHLRLILVLLFSLFQKNAFSNPTTASNYTVKINHLEIYHDFEKIYTVKPNLPRSPEAVQPVVGTLLSDEYFQILLWAEIKGPNDLSIPIFYQTYSPYQVIHLLNVILANPTSDTFEAQAPSVVPNNIPSDQRATWLLEACFFNLQYRKNKVYTQPSLKDLAEALADTYWDRYTRYHEESLLIANSCLQRGVLYEDMLSLLNQVLDPNHSEELRTQWIRTFTHRLNLISSGYLTVAGSIFRDDPMNHRGEYFQIPERDSTRGLSLVITPFNNTHETFEVLTLQPKKPPRTLGVRQLSSWIPSIDAALNPSAAMNLLSRWTPGIFRRFFTTPEKAQPCDQFLEPIQRR